jgi:aryl-alcohol dehydrogenase-like predicted oxidoreductase
MAESSRPPCRQVRPGTPAAAVTRRQPDCRLLFFDDAELYGWGDNEKVVGRALKPVRDEVVIAKFGSGP